MAVKLISLEIPHKTEARIIQLNVDHETAIGHAYRQVMENAKECMADAKIMGILVQEMTASIREVLEGVKRSDTELTVVRTVGAPPAIQSASDIAQAVPPMLELVGKANDEGYDAVILACFSDPGLEAARKQSDILVMGIEETTLHVATMLGHKYTIPTPLSKRIPSKEQDVRRFKAESAMASVRALDLTVTETETDPSRTKARILEVATTAVKEDGAEVIVLGCAGMTGYADDVEQQLGVVVLDPTTVTLKVCEALIDVGLRHCKRALYAAPLQ